MSWHCKPTGGYGYGTQEARDNAEQIYFLLTQKGWGLGAISGVLGNLQFESEMNPWRWQSDIALNSGDPAIDYSTTNGYGLFQFTPAGKYVHSSIARGYAGFNPKYANTLGGDFDGYAQVCFVNDHADYVPHPDYPVPYASYKTFNLNPRYCARVWCANYERGTASPLREDYAEIWFNYLSNVSPQPPINPPGYVGNVPIGAIVTRRGGAAVANVWKRRFFGYSQNRSRWSREWN